MSSTPIFYSWDDAGSPGRNLSGNTQNRLKQILKACLVDGYGSKPAAGWEMAHEHADGFSVKNTEGVINFVNRGSDIVDVYIAETITDASKALIDGPGLRSYNWSKTNTGGGKQSLDLGLLLNEYPGFLKWFLVANEQSVTLNLFITSLNIDRPRYQEFISFGVFKSLPLAGRNIFYALGGVSVTDRRPLSVFIDPYTGLDAADGFLLRHSSINTVLAGESGNFHEITPVRLSVGDGTDEQPTKGRAGYIPGVCILLEVPVGICIKEYIESAGLESLRNVPDLFSAGGFNYSAMIKGARSSVFFCTDNGELW